MKNILSRFTIGFAICLFTSINCQAQTESYEVDLHSPDLVKLDNLTFEAVNELRKEVNLPELVYDEVLHWAAKDHADYLIQKKELSHYQDASKKKTPLDRVRIHGGLVYRIVGENIVEVPLGAEFSVKGRKRSTVSYLATAQAQALSWRLSSPHYQNIVSKRYNSTAVASSYDTTNRRLVTVQVFAYTHEFVAARLQPDHSGSLLKMKSPKLPFHLKPYRFKVKDEKAI